VQERLDIVFLPRCGLRIAANQIVHAREQRAYFVAGFRVEQRLDGRLDRQALDAPRLHSRALHGVAKRATELARPGAEVEKPIGLAVGGRSGECSPLPPFVVHAKKCRTDRLGLVRQALQPAERVAGLHEPRREQ